MDRRGFFRSVLGKGLTHGARQVDAVILPFERAARAARDAMPHDEDAGASLDDLVAIEEDESALDPEPALRPHPAVEVTQDVADEDLMRLAADAGLVRHVEAVIALSRRTLRLVPGFGTPEPGSRTRFGGAPDLPADVAWPSWDEEPLTFVAQLDLAEARAAGLEPLLPTDGALLVFTALERTPGGSSPLDRASTRAIHVESARLPAVTPEPAGASAPEEARRVRLSSELTLPRVWHEDVQALGMDELEQSAFVRVRERLAEAQGVTAWDAADDLRSLHHLLGTSDESSGDLPLACELAARDVDVGYGRPRAHPDAAAATEAARRWRLLLQLTVDDELGWSFGERRERLYLLAPADELAAGAFANVHGIAR